MQKLDINTLAWEAEKAAQKQAQIINEKVNFNLNKVLNGFKKHRISELHLNSSTGYGYNDIGRDALEELYADIFQGEDALVRHQVVSGTHAIALSFFGNLLPGDELLMIGKPYDTLYQIIGTNKKERGTLRELGVKYREFPIEDNGSINVKALLEFISPNTRMISLQRSKGYQWRSSLTIAEIAQVVKSIRSKWPHLIIFVDNCYGEFVEDKEPLEVGVDLIAGSLIKNPGGGIAPCGGYIVGKKNLVERAAARLTAPGIGKEIGPSLGNNRLFYQGLFHAPQVVGEALWGVVYAAALYQGLGLEVLPQPDEMRTDIIQAIKLGNIERIIAFCRGIQGYSPIDSHVTPIASDVPGYKEPVIMAAGAFTQGSSIELSADAPMRSPYAVYLQGGISRFHVKIAVTETLKHMVSDGLFK